jgi:hypothetical protein
VDAADCPNLTAWARNLIPGQSFLALDYSFYLLVRCLPWAVFRISHPPAKSEQESIGTTTIEINAWRENTQVVWQSNTVGGNIACRY